jgi:hypothetical protein
MNQNTAIKNFLSDCPALGLQPTWAALSTREIRALDLRQIRKVKNILAIAEEPVLGNLVVLTARGQILNLTHAEALTFEKNFS